MANNNNRTEKQQKRVKWRILQDFYFHAALNSKNQGSLYFMTQCNRHIFGYNFNFFEMKNKKRRKIVFLSNAFQKSKFF